MILPLLLLTSDLYVVSVGLHDVNADGTRYFPNDTLPAQFLMTYSNTVPLAAKFQVTASCSTTKSSGNKSAKHAGEAYVNFSFKSASTSEGTHGVTVNYTVEAMSTADGSTYASGGKTISKASQINPARSVQLQVLWPTDDDMKSDPTSPNTVTIQWKYPNAYWAYYSAGYTSTTLIYGTDTLSAAVSSYYSGGGEGNIPVSIAHGNSSHRVYVGSAYLTGTGGRAGLQFNALGTLSDRPVYLGLKNQYGSPIENFLSTSINGNSDVDLNASTTGTYLVTISAAGMLRKQISVTLTPGSNNNIGTVATYLGDINGDNVINSSDLALITKYLGVASGSDRWIYGDEDDKFCGSNCDLNGDGTVSSADYAIANSNLGQVGD